MLGDADPGGVVIVGLVDGNPVPQPQDLAERIALDRAGHAYARLLKGLICLGKSQKGKSLIDCL